MNKLTKIVYHWTAGRNYPNDVDLSHYHFLIDKDGKIYEGKYKPEDNINCQDGIYAAHVGGGNTGAIGIALCGMYNFYNRYSVGNYPLTKRQLEASFKLGAQLAKKYNIPNTANTIMTHYEFGLKHPNTTSHGKIDIIYLPPYPHIAKEDCGAFIRSKIKWYATKI
jgi:N-acetyl-anhydromuramyl-L-alanine amidase AmpD